MLIMRKRKCVGLISFYLLPCAPSTCYICYDLLCYIFTQMYLSSIFQPRRIDDGRFAYPKVLQLTMSFRKDCGIIYER